MREWKMGEEEQPTPDDAETQGIRQASRLVASGTLSQKPRQQAQPELPMLLLNWTEQ